MSNFYDDPLRAASYESVGATGTYAIAFRELASILERLPRGGRALDFGCGAGRSSRFLQRAGYDVVGVDIAREMVALARQADGRGDYRVLSGEDALGALAAASFSVVLVAWTFDNVRERSEKRRILEGLSRLLTETGTLILIAATPELYTHEWASFTTVPFPDNRHAKSGDTVCVRIKATEDDRPYKDTLFGDADYRQLFAESGFDVRGAHRPLGLGGDPWEWLSETETAPWVLYELSTHPAPSRATRGS